MLLKVKYLNVKKYIKLHAGFTYLEFISEAKTKFGLPDAADLDIFDETDTAVEEDIFLELLEAQPDLCLTIREKISDEDFCPLAHSTPSSSDTLSSLTDTISLSSSDSDLREKGIPAGRSRSSKDSSAPNVSVSEAAKEMVKNALTRKPGGEEILEEYNAENSLSHRTRRQLVNILASDMTERHGRIPSRKQKEKYALGIITLFPSLKDPFSPNGYEHFYDGVKGTGYVAWRLKTMSRSTTKRPVKEVPVHQEQGPKRRRLATTLPQQLDGDACKEAISFLVHSPDESSVFQKMKMTFQHRQDLVHDPQRTADVFKTFPRFLDVKGLSCCSIDEHLQARDGKQPYILAVGRTQNSIDTFYIAVDKQLIPCQATSSLSAFDELFKSHYVFNLSYDESLVHLYSFVQTTIFNIDATSTDESPRVRELRAKMLNENHV
ncbi:unnamed protein product [Oreochromis niloticus]|nr:unnamed protein product [Mustela putorius furo]